MRKEVDEIDRWLRATGMKAGRLGLLAVANARAVQRVRDGTAQLATLEGVLNYIRTNPAVRKQR